MIINHASLSAIFTGFKSSFMLGLGEVIGDWEKIATRVPSTDEVELYPWLRDMPDMREWIGARHVHDTKVEDYTLRNKTFESTLAVQRTKIEDDRFGVYTPIAQEMGRSAQRHSDVITFQALDDGDDAILGVGFDDVSFFNDSHPTEQGTDTPSTGDNIDTSAGAVSSKWFLMDTSRVIKPLLYQTRTEPEFVSKQSLTDDNVFDNDEFKFGVRARRAAGYGFWQLAYQSINNLTEANIDLYIESMMSLRGWGGARLGVKPSLLVCGPSRRSEALNVLKRERDASGASNRSFGTLDLLITPFLT